MVVEVIRFEIGERDAPAEGTVEAVDILVNGRNLVETLRELELPFATREGKPDLAGRYAGLRPADVFLPSSRLLGGEPMTYDDHGDPEGKTAVLGCVCGEVDCWPFLVRIKLREDVVIWDGFE